MISSVSAVRPLFGGAFRTDGSVDGPGAVASDAIGHRWWSVVSKSKSVGR